MPKQRWTLEEKKQHVDRWRASGLTCKQYCERHDIPFYTLRDWPTAIAKAGRRTNESDTLTGPVPTDAAVEMPPQVVNDPVMLFLPDGGCISCHYTQLAGVCSAIKHAGVIF